LALSSTYSTVLDAADGGTKVSFAPRDGQPSLPVAPVPGATLVLSAPPRENAEQGEQIFNPIAEYLSRVIGRPVVFRYSATWGGYQTDMQRGVYDIVFDGPHFVSWRIKNSGHNVLVKLSGDFVVAAVVRSDNKSATSLKAMGGHTVCAHAPPNLGTLILLNEFDNPSRQPNIVVREGFKQIFESVKRGECEVGILPLPYLKKFDPEQKVARILFRTNTIPQQAFSAGPRLSTDEQQRIKEALLSPAAAPALANFHKDYGAGRKLISADNNEYSNQAVYLRDQWGF
jgi:ABC-type phosphate/phosphonate transport system substrate-binding protein